ncbi:MAG: hypothetical protein FJ125_07490 [Deltaproteobacteria bacterium]|nr:hypothetical protein [Deltaproteobacteria bacterium]
MFFAKETTRVCVARCTHRSGALVTVRSESLALLVPHGAVFGYDVEVHIGLERFVRHHQREEIRGDLKSKFGISISSGEVSALARRFLGHLGALHSSRAPAIRDALARDGGYPLHIDATGEAGRGTLLVAIAGWRQWVLGSWKISTERADLILPCLRQTVRRFGPPCAAMRDLGKAMTPALDDLVSELKLEIPVLACHQHFLADVGKDLLEPAHAQLRALFRQTKVCPSLRALVRDLGRTIGKDIDTAREAVHRWQSLVEDGHQVEPGLEGLAEVRALAQWTLDFKAQATGLDFPFDRPYLDLYDRCMTTLRAADAFLRNPPLDRSVTAALRRLHRDLEPVDCEVPFCHVTERLRRRAALFDELRGVLRMTASIPEQETEQDLGQMHDQLDELVASLRQRRPARGPAQDTREAIDLILGHIDAHGTNLWGHAIRLPESAGGSIRLVSRTNFISENFFGEFKHDERRRSGRKNLGQDLENLPAEAALVPNLEHDDYVSLLCGSLDRLPQAFAELDRDERDDRLRGVAPLTQDEESLGTILQIASASLSSPDRRIIRTDDMNRRIAAAAQSRAPRCRC